MPSPVKNDWARNPLPSCEGGSLSAMNARYGVYMGIINMMIVVPMLIQSVTFGAIYENVLGANPNNAIRFAGVLLGLAGLTMLWIKEPPIVRDVDEVSYMPSAGH